MHAGGKAVGARYRNFDQSKTSSSGTGWAPQDDLTTCIFDITTKAQRPHLDMNTSRFCYDARLQSKSPPAALDFHDARFFREHDASELPDPADVLAAHGSRAGRAIFPGLQLFIKFGPDERVRIEEAQVLQAVRRAFRFDQVPSPELIAWRRIDDISFIYMELIPGTTLKDAWPSLTHEERRSITMQLGSSIDMLKTPQQHPGHEMIGSISATKVQDVSFETSRSKGPFSSVKEFNDNFQDWAFRLWKTADRHQDQYRAYLPDRGAIHFTHADLHLNNILVSGQQGSRSIAAIIDWGQSGWYPEYWEYCKMIHGTSGHAFETEDWFMLGFKVYELEWRAFMNYWRWAGYG